jgi:type I restriction enzyme, S subunit
MTWAKTTLGEFAPFAYGKSLPKEQRVPGVVPVYGSNGVVGSHIAAFVDGPSVIVGRKGSVGEVHLSEGPSWPIDTAFFAKGSDRADLYFLYYLLKTLPITSNSDSAVPGLNRDFAHSLEFRAPSLQSQRAIGLALSIFDEKIAANIKVSKTLEDIAQTLFKSWFIDFDPVKAKVAGDQPSGMDDETASLFPGSLVDSEHGSFPQGWAILTLGDLLTPKKGKTITKARTSEGEVPVVAGGLQPAYYHNESNVNHPVVTISASGANAGFVRLYLRDIWASDCSFISQEVHPNVFFWYLFLLNKQEQIYGMQQGAAQPHIYPSDLMRLRVCTPQKFDLISKFEELVAPLFHQIGALGHQSQTLRSIRDSLLPRLISGDLQVPDEMLAE